MDLAEAHGALDIKMDMEQAAQEESTAAMKRDQKKAGKR